MAVLEETNDVAISETMKEVRHSLDRERRRTTDEREAFELFAKKIRDLQPSPSPPSQIESRPCIHRSPEASSARSVTAIKAYKATVMSVPHYTEEYDETPLESFTAEFSPEISAALFQEGNFTQEVKRSLLARIDASITERETHLDTIENESDSVETAYDRMQSIRDELRSIESTDFYTASFGALDGYRRQLESLFESCNEGAAERQNTIQRQRRHGRISTEVVDVQPYIYGDMSARYPILSLYSTISSDIDELISEVDAAAVAYSG